MNVLTPVTRPAAGAADLDDMAAAIVRHLLRRPAGTAGGPEVRAAAADGELPGAVLVSGTAAGPAGGVVAAAVDDDPGRYDVVRYAAALARHRGVPLRVVHVWDGVRASHERMSDADRLLSKVLYEQLTTPEAEAAEREILHDGDVVAALAALSAELAALVVAARGRPSGPGGLPAGVHLGGTVRQLAGRTACPLAVVPWAPVLNGRGPLR
ncbi:hypothetical protein GCM10020358_29570 [Amorphoplanes nipponensis]|uniref:UspA domain-containing protein n=1 Tax=Actinoplanes nipponensis TaxID=135950 RepID=A0A919JNS5_9ACTN|nr:universal stress protein [Actinoplanes nipponensis]GIE54163.1 hypothetical protein Ani05nite_76970 [Actinoplanes nipponensis]